MFIGIILLLFSEAVNTNMYVYINCKRFITNNKIFNLFEHKMGGIVNDVIHIFLQILSIYYTLF